MGQLTRNIQKWATVRELHTADPNKQILKLGEEFGELCEGMAKGKPDQVKDSIGDIYVVLTILAMHRCGEMVNGVFVKESDL
ncbi:MazG-like family protein [Paenibacillus sp. TAB 01]|uniref:MazG-like family protein n=1 Tax=Paenibacillus sp. TAB 01 TaxID=3368988 RepID=UPI0037512605